MEAVQSSLASARAGAAALVVDSAASAPCSSRQASARAFLSRKPLPCQGLSASTSFCYNALASKVCHVESGSSGGRRAVVKMLGDNAATGYASALAELAQSTGNLEAIHTDIESFAEILKSPEIYEFLTNPVIVDEKKKSILKTLAEDANFNPFTLNFFCILVEKKRFNIILEVVKEFSSLYYELTDTQVATVASAVKIEKAQLALIAKKIQSLSGAKNVRIKNVIDPSLIAGFVVKYGKDGSRFVDMSVKGQLDRLAHQFEFADKVGAF